MNQSIQEVNRIFEEWKANYAPKDLLLDGENGTFNINALVDYLVLHFARVASITNLDAACANLPNLKYKPKKTALELREEALKYELEFRAKELKRIKREELENSIPFDRSALIQQEADKKAQDKDAAMVQSQIKSLIESYECYRAGRVDFTTTASRKKELRAYHAANKHRDQKQVLVEIRKMIVDFPNRDERSKR
jgi:hypothetical protein